MYKRKFQILSILLIFVLLFALCPTNVYAAYDNSPTNYKNFLKEFPHGDTYENNDINAYWYSEEPNKAFIYQFYREVFDIPLYNLKMDYNTKTVSTKDEEEMKSFFQKLNPGDYLFMSGYYSIFIDIKDNMVTLYDVGQPLGSGGENRIHHNTYELAKIANFTESIKSYSPNQYGYKLFTYQQSVNVYDIHWGMDISNDNELSIYLDETAELKVVAKNGEDMTKFMKFVSRNPTIVSVDNDKIKGTKVGTATIVATSNLIDLEAPLYLTVIVLKNGDDKPQTPEYDYDEDTVDWKVGGMTENENGTKHLTLPEGATQSLNAVLRINPYKDINKYISYSSANNDIAFVKNKKVVANSVGCTNIFMLSTEDALVLPSALEVCVSDPNQEIEEYLQLETIDILLENKKIENNEITIGLGDVYKISVMGTYTDGSTEDVTNEFIEHVVTTNYLVTQIIDNNLVANAVGTTELTITNEKAKEVLNTCIIKIKVVDPIHESYNPPIEPYKTIFPDISGHWAQNHIEKLAKAQIVNGFEDSTFRPNDYVTLEQAIKIVVNLSKQLPNTTKNENKKIEYWVSQWALPYMKSALPYLNEEHYRNGFYGTLEATRAEVIDMVANALLETPRYSTDINTIFNDASTIPTWSLKSFEVLYDLGIIEGDNFRNANPNNKITRAELCKIIVLAFNL